MNVAHCVEDLRQFLNVAHSVADERTVVVSKFIENAKEIDVDVVCLNGKVLCMAISEHVENAGLFICFFLVQKGFKVFILEMQL